MIDTNVIIDFLIAREPFYNSALQVIKKCASGEVNGYIAFHSLPNLWYILRKIPEETRREWLEKICKILNVTSATHEAVIKAIKMENFKDFETSIVSAITPEEWLKKHIARFTYQLKKYKTGKRFGGN